LHRQDDYLVDLGLGLENAPGFLAARYFAFLAEEHRHLNLALDVSMYKGAARRDSSQMLCKPQGKVFMEQLRPENQKELEQSESPENAENAKHAIQAEDASFLMNLGSGLLIYCCNLYNDAENTETQDAKIKNIPCIHKVIALHCGEFYNEFD
jgi:hypothetical protein